MRVRQLFKEKISTDQSRGVCLSLTRASQCRAFDLVVAPVGVLAIFVAITNLFAEFAILHFPFGRILETIAMVAPFYVAAIHAGIGHMRL